MHEYEVRLSKNQKYFCVVIYFKLSTFRKIKRKIRKFRLRLKTKTPKPFYRLDNHQCNRGDYTSLISVEF